MGLFDAQGEVVDKWEIVTRKDNAGELILPDIAESILNKNKEKDLTTDNIIGIGIGVPGPVTAAAAFPAL